MSNEALSVIAKMDIRPSGRKFVAMALADFADENWSCFPSVSQLAAYTSQGEKTVRDHLEALADDGIITRERLRYEDGKMGRYRYVLTSGDSRQWRNSPAAKNPQNQRRNSPDNNPHNNHHNIILGAREELAKVLDAEHVDAVLEHRKKTIRKPLTAHAAKLLAGKFALCADPNAAADEMISNGWQGFNPEWLRKPARPQQPEQNVMTAALERAKQKAMQ